MSLVPEYLFFKLFSEGSFRLMESPSVIRSFDFFFSGFFSQGYLRQVEHRTHISMYPHEHTSHVSIYLISVNDQCQLIPS